ncbi:MAG: ABC transporter ATP-binding protein, partial [Bacteroidota bacterium]
PTGILMAHATNDISAAREFLGPAIMYAANTVTAFIFVLYFMLSINVSITLLVLAPLPLIAFSVYKIGNKVHFAFRDVQEQFSKLTAQAQETFSGIRVVRAYGREAYEKGRFTGIAKDYVKRNLRLARLQALFMPVLVLLVGLSELMVLTYGGSEAIHSRLSLGGLTQFFIYVGMLIWPVAAIGWVTNLVQQAAASTGRLGKIFDAVPDIKDNKDTDYSLTELQGNIKFDKVSLQYEPELPFALKDISIEISQGDSLGIVGTVGCGKSSLVSLIPRMYDSSSGIISIDGRDIRKIPLSLLRKNIGIVPQDTFLFSMSIADNIRFGKDNATKEEVYEAAKIAQFDDDVKSFPTGYDSILGERGITLSGGQKQRLAIARAVIKNPHILILDDALSAVDSQTEEKILSGLREFMKGRTTIIISHRISAVKDSDRIITLDNGEIIETGTHEELLKKGGRYSEMYNLQQLQREIEEL